MKKVFTLLTLALMSIGSAWAEDTSASNGTWPDANCCVLNGSLTQIGSVTFELQGKWSGNGNAKDCIFNGNTFNQGAYKPGGSAWIKFTTSGVATITVVQSLKDTGNNRAKAQVCLNDVVIYSKTQSSTLVYRTYSNVDGNADIQNATADDTNNSEVRIWKFYNMPAGNYTLKRISSGDQMPYAYVGVTYETTSTLTIATAMSNEGTSTVSGGGDYYPSDSVILAASPGAGKAFVKWSTDGGTNEVSTENPYCIYATAAATYTAVFNDAATKSIIVAANDNEMGEAAATATTVAEGATTTLTATPASEAYYFVNWTKSSDASWESTENPLENIAYDDIVDGETYTANFAAYKKFVYSKGEYDVGSQDKYMNGSQTMYASTTGQITLPKNNYIVANSDMDVAMTKTMKYWSNGGPNYSAGGAYTISDDLTDMVPGFSTNTVSLSLLAEPQTVTWNFDASTSAPFHVEKATGYMVTQTTIGSETIDVPMAIDATGTYEEGSNTYSAKFYNVGRANAQINKNTKLTIPAVKGMVVTIKCSEKDLMTSANTTVAGEGVTIDTDDNSVATYTYNGTASTVEILMNAGRYYNYVQAEYPKATVTITPAKEYTTYVTPAIMDFDGTGLTAYKATAATTKEVTMIPVTTVPAGTPLVLKKGTEASYDVPVVASADAITDNKLVASDGVTTIGGDTKYDYILSDGKFYRASAGVLAKGKAYLHLDAAPADAARELVMSFGDEATGIDSVTRDALTNGKVYNLQGQEVKNAQKGIFIVNGRKVVLK